MATLTITISDKALKQALEQAAEECGYKVKPGWKITDILPEMTTDVNLFITNDLSDFFVGGIDGSCYQNVLETADNDDEDGYWITY